MVEINKNILSSSKYSLKCPYSMTPQYITIHNTANDASAENEIKYMLRNDSSTSYHFAVDDKEIIQGIPLNRNAWHCGDGSSSKSGNRTSIGIEICYSKSGGERYVEAEENAVQLTAQLLKERGWGIDRVKQHYDWSKKDCPHRIRKENRWDSFLERVQKAMSNKNVSTASSPAENTKVENTKEDIRMFNPSSSTINNEFIKILESAFENKIISDKSWIVKAKAGQLKLDDAIVLVALINNRNK